MPNEDQIEIRDKRDAPWFWVDNDLIDTYANSLGLRALSVYLTLCRHSDNRTQTCYPSMRTIAERLGLSTRTVIRATSKLEKLGFITIIRKRKKDGTNASNVYTLASKKAWKTDHVTLVSHGAPGDTSVTTHVTPVSHHQVTPGPHNNTKSNKPKINKTHLRASPQKKIKTPQSLAINREINRIATLFEPINRDWQSFFRPGPQRTSIEKLIKFVCKDEITIDEVIEKAKSLHGEKFAPQAYTPSELVYNYSKIMAWDKLKPKVNLATGDPYTPGKFKDVKVLRIDNK